MKKNILIAVLLFATIGSQAQSCASMPLHFASYEAAMSFVRGASFKIKDEIRIYKSSWLTRGEYYSCDGYTGIFIFTTDKGYEYIMRDMPVSVWKGFKNASDYGVYYNQYIRGKYHFPL